jgi:anti-sigma factor ChrR (cupin superfamily)
MSKPVNPDANGPAEYALGLIRGEERREMDAQLASDDGLRSQVERWQGVFAQLEITYRVLHVDETLKRQSLLVKMEPGAVYKAHGHDINEECLVIEGDLRFGDLHLHTGDFHLATPAMVHPTGRTEQGCLLHVVVGLDI